MPCRLSVVVAWLVLITLPTTSIWAAEPPRAITIELDAGQVDRCGVPVFFELPKGLQGCEALELVRLDNNRPVPVQIDEASSPVAVWMIGDRLAAGQRRRYRLAPSDPAAKTVPGVTVIDNGSRLDAKVGDRTVLAYNHAVVACPDREQAWFDRSGFIHPLYSPAGRVLTDGMPPDHYHQHGIMFPWTNTTFEGRKVDFWNSKALQGKVEHVKVAGTDSGPVFGSFIVELAHVDLTAPDGAKRALDERWLVRVYNRSDGFLFDLVSTQTCASASPLSINEYHYGAMAFRGAREWFDLESGDFLTSEGKSRADGNHSRPRWVDAFGEVDGRTAGVTVFSNPENYRFPQPVRLHPKKPYFCFSPMVLGQFEIAPGEPYVSSYRYWTHDGPLDRSTAEQIWQALAYPPRVRITQ